MGCLAVLLGLIGACYAPDPQPGAPCDDVHPCPRPLLCAVSTSTCARAELDATIDATPDAAIDAPPIPGCTPMGFDTCGDGLDQDCDGQDKPCAVNDVAGGAIEITAGGVFTGDLLLAKDDAPERGCAAAGGRDLYYQIKLTAPEVYYLATFGSNFDTTVRVFPGVSCASLGNQQPVCSDDACGGSASQLAAELPAGTSCVVVDQNAAATAGALKLTVVRGGRAGSALPAGVQTLTGDTCTGADLTTSMCSDVGGKDLGYYFTVCPGVTSHVDATTCGDPTATHFDTVLYVRPAGGANLVCDDDGATCGPRTERPDHADGSILADVATSGPGLFWLVVDGFNTSACGGFQLDTNLH